MEPIFLEPIYKNNVWGGNEISKIKNIRSEKVIGESWEIAANKNGNNLIKNGDFKGLTLQQLFEKEENRIELFGQYCKKMKKFPILIKFIDAKENLSVQVHPNNFYAKKLEKDTGKTEMWYIMKCSQDGKIICGLNEKIKTKQDIKEITANNIVEKLNYLQIKEGDSILIKSGTVHAIMANTVICEIQQNSDLTYRVYDWDRNDKSRKLHIRQSRQVIKNRKTDIINNKSTSFKKVQPLSHNKFFFVDKIHVDNIMNDCSNTKSFKTVTVVEGNGKFICENNEYNIKKGESFIIPSNLGKYKLTGNLEILITYIGKK